MNQKEISLDQRIEELVTSMTNIKPNKEQIKRIEEIRIYYQETGKAILLNCPQSRNLNIAITSLEESLHRAIKSIILEGF